MGSGNPPAPEWRAVQHRVRNDLQTMGALWRLARRRAASDVLVEDFPSWLNALSAVYDSVPLWQADDRVAVVDLLAALRTRFGYDARFEFAHVGQSCMPTQMAIAGAIALSGLLSFSAASCAPGSVVKISVTTSDNVTRMEAAFPPGPSLAEWPPLGLAVAAEAAGAQYATGPDGDLQVAVLVIPCH